MRGLFTVIFLATSLVVSFQPSFAESDSKDLFTIAAILPLSGSVAPLGVHLRNAIQLAYSELPSERQKIVKLIIEDDGFKATQSVSIFQRLVAGGKVDAFLVVGSSIGNAVGPLAEQKQVPLIAIGASDANIVADKDFVFLHWVTPEVESRTMVAEIKRRDYKHLGLAFAEQEGAIALWNALMADLKRENLEGIVAIDERFLPDAMDFRTYLTKAKKLDVDVIALCLFPGAISSFAKQHRTLDVKADLTAFELFEDENEVKAADGTLLGQWYVNADVGATAFEDAYIQRFRVHPGWAAANAYDSFNLLIEAAEDSGVDPKSITSALSKVQDYQGAAGVYSATGDNRFTLPAAVKVVTKDGFEKLEIPK